MSYISVRYRLTEGTILHDISLRIFELFGSSNPDADNIESLLPQVSAPPTNRWVRTRMTTSQAINIAEYVAVSGMEGLGEYVEVLWPTEIIEGEEVPVEYEQITWEEGLEIDGEPVIIDDEQVMVTKRIGDIK